MSNKESIIVKAARMASEAADQQRQADENEHESRYRATEDLDVGLGGALVPKTATARDIMRMRDASFFSDEELAARRIIYDNMEDTAVQAAFMNLRTNILRRCQNKGSVILVTTVSYDGGASFVSINLAAALAADETKTSLLVNCNMGKTGVVDDLTDSDAKGVSDFIDNPELSAHEIIHPSGIRRVRIIPPGTKRNSYREFFTDKRWRKLIRELKHRYRDRYVIVDSPPLGQSATAETLQDVVDYVLIVVPYGKISDRQLKAATRQIPPEKVLGVVMNDTPNVLAEHQN
jgi:Mrp family chromosome partitioning ATPase